MQKNRIIPFSWLPASWGLSGPPREIAEAHYYYDGYPLAVRLAEIELSGKELELRLLNIKHEYGFLTDHEYEVEWATVEHDDPVQRKIALIETDMRYGAVDAFEADKEIATLKGEAWIRVVNDGVRKDEGADGYFFEFDWNGIWIEQLREAGFHGPSEEAVIQAWFQELCRQEASASLGAPPINGGVFRD